MPKPLAILLPVYNDEPSLLRVLKDIQTDLQGLARDLKVFIINDGSNHWFPDKLVFSFVPEVIHLVRNLGHQKAIAIGLAYIKENYPGTAVIVMDSDGEDKVTDITKLIAASEATPAHIIFAARSRRTNGKKFKLFYYLYKMSFYLLTGKKISFGNFALIPSPALNKLVYYSEIWNNLPGGIIKSGLPYSSKPIERANRYSSESKMNFNALLLHGLGAISVFLEIVITRIAIISFLLMLFSAITIITIIIIRLATTLAIPGWASTLSSSMLIILLISFIISLIAIFIYLSAQAQQKIIPALHYKDYILRTETVSHAG
ncbi:MAG: glycosyl transferase family 2 [Ferruginibacter sp.]|nr:glycosyl transferase family 2 [Ferruginibacter sp.]